MLMKTTRQSAAEIAASVRKTDEHQQIEAKVAEMKALHAAEVEAQKKLIREDRNGANTQLIMASDREIKRIEAEMRPLRMRLPELREEHGKRVARALAPLRSEIAIKMMAIIDEIEPDSHVLHETTVLTETAGYVDVRQRIAMPWWDQLRMQLSRLAEQG